MGMISRVRRRLRSDSFSKMDPRIQEEKIANTVCLVSILLLLPYWSRACAPHAPLVLACGMHAAAGYSCLVLPLLATANYRYPAWWYPTAIKHATALLMKLKGPVVAATKPLLIALKWLYEPILRLEDQIASMNNLFTIVCQLLFFVTCELATSPERDQSIIGGGSSGARLTALYSLMFYNAIAYCVNYVRELTDKRGLSWRVNIAHHSDVEHLAMTTTKIVLEWTKAVTFIITVLFTLLAMGAGSGLSQFKPTALYQILTWLYYMATEKAFVELWPLALSLARWQRLEGLDALWAAAIVRCAAVVLACMVALGALARGRSRSAALATLYAAVWLRARHCAAVAVRHLRAELARLERFPSARAVDLARLHDVCAICLSAMSMARVTPCKHYFHAECLRRCLDNSDKCPICMQQFNNAMVVVCPT